MSIINTVVVAIDFGTEASGYAFSWTAKKNDIITTNWPLDNYVKTSTTLLLKKDLSFDSFGTDACNKFFGLDSEERGEYVMFKNFKMSLYKDSNSQRTTLVKAVNCNREVSVHDLVKECLKYLKSQAIIDINKGQCVPISLEHIKWIVTVPAIWDTAARLAMTNAAIQAGLTEDGKKGFNITLEPEAASIYCTMDLALNLPPGSKYMIIDAGGGTIDITAHKVLENNFLKEIFPASGGPWGASYVNKNFEHFLNELFNGETDKDNKPFNMASFTTTQEFFSIMNEFETAKRSCKWADLDTVRKNVNIGEIICHFSKETLDKIQTKWSQQHPDLKFQIKSNTIFIFQKLIREIFFVPLFTKIENHVKTLLEKPEIECEGNFYIFLVGGFAMSDMLQNFIRKSFDGINKGTFTVKVRIPNRPGFAVLSGAVNYGYNPKTITSRVSPYTIGVSTIVPYNKAHPISKKVIYAGKAYCEDVFDTFIRKSEEVDEDKVIQRSYTAVHPQQHEIEIVILTADKPMVDFTTDPGVVTLGYLYLTIPDKGLPNAERIVDVEIKFGGVCVDVRAIYRKTGANVKAELKFDLCPITIPSNVKKEQTVDLAFCMDCTGSMRRWMKEAKKRVTSIADEVKNQYSKLKLNIAFVAYRDIKDQKRLETKNFTLDYISIKKFIGRLVAVGGGDTPEDVFGGLNKVLSLSWGSDVRLLIHVADAPCHGKIFHNQDDDYPEGDPNGLQHSTIMENLKEKGIEYHFIKINSFTDKMITEFRKFYDDDQKKIVVHSLLDNTKALTPTIITCICSSLTPYIPSV